MLIYKILRDNEWTELCENGQTSGAPIDLEDGYIHLSTGAQVGETVAKYFYGVERLSILALDSDTLGGALKWEPSRGGALFPHLYRELKMSDVLWQTNLELSEQGHVFPDGVLT